ncbi:hypothetical protein O9992_00690 [Vibrio lentus]|nr:hypothetical protein [Vibrio lentus]
MENGKPKGILAEQIRYFQRTLKVRRRILCCCVQVSLVERSELLSVKSRLRGDIAQANLIKCHKKSETAIGRFQHPIRSDIDELL